MHLAQGHLDRMEAVKFSLFEPKGDGRHKKNYFVFRDTRPLESNRRPYSSLRSVWGGKKRQIHPSSFHWIAWFQPSVLTHLRSQAGCTQKTFGGSFKHLFDIQRTQNNSQCESIDVHCKLENGWGHLAPCGGPTFGRKLRITAITFGKTFVSK